MTKLKHDIIIAFKSRPLSVVALLMIAGIVIMYKADILYAGYSDYCIDSDNELSKCGIYPGDTIRLSGKVYDISQKEFYGKLSMTITLSDVIWEYNNIPLTRKRQYIQVYSDVSDVKMGQEITVEGKIKYFEKATNEGQFDAYSFYRNRGILFLLEKGNIIRKSAKYSRIRQCLYSIKMNSEQILDEKLGQEDAAIAKAMILGMKGDIDKEIKESFQKNGIAHILAISGLHISFLCMTLYRLLQKLRIPVWLSVTVSILFLVAYVLMVGFSASAFRAAVMFILYLLATALKRTYDLMTALSVAAILVLISNPGYLFDASFQLSFTAIIAVGLFLKSFINNVCNIYATPGKIRVYLMNSLCVSLVVFLITMPVILNCYYEIPLYSVILNLIIIPLMSVLLISTILIILLTTTVDELAFIPVKITTVILWIYKNTCHVLEESGIGRTNLGKPDWWKIILYYLILLIVFNYRGNYKKLIFPLGIISASVILCANIPHAPRLIMLDVGQGDCFVFFNDNGNVYLWDGGSTSVNNVGDKRIIPYLKSKGVNRIEGVFLSHPDEDHINGIEQLLEQSVNECIDIQHIYVYEGLRRSKEYAGILAYAAENRVEVHGIARNDRIEDDNLIIDCLYPYRGNASDDSNDLSLVLYVTYKDFSFLETGDITGAKESELVRGIAPVEIDILKVAHHGSSSSTSDAFLEWSNPKVALISAGKDNSYGHPHKEVIDALKLRRTALLVSKDMGEVTVYIDKSGKIKKITRFTE